MWDDAKVSFAPDRACISCKIATARKVNRGKSSLGQPTGPGQILFVDLEDNPYKYQLTYDTTFKNYFIISCLYSRYTVLIGTNGASANDLINALISFHREWPPFPGYNFAQHLLEIRSDAGTIFAADELIQFAHRCNFRIRRAAPEHQEQNGPAERPWQTIRKISFSISCHARVGPEYFHESMIYAQHIYNVLPIKGLFPALSDAENRNNIDPNKPATPYFMYFNDKPRVARFRVFGCPCFIKIYIKKKSDNNDIVRATHLNPKNNAQRGVRGIFTGFPHNQAGYRVYVPTANKFYASCDVSFDENFESIGLSYDRRLFRDAMTTRSKGDSIDPTLPQESTGVPAVFLQDEVPPSERDSPWVPYTRRPPAYQADDPTPLYPHSEELIPQDTSSIEEGEGEDQQSDQDEAASIASRQDDASQSSDVTPQSEVSDSPSEGECTNVAPLVPMVSTRSTAYSYDPKTGERVRISKLNVIQEVICTVVSALEIPYVDSQYAELIYSLEELVTGDPGGDPTPFLPEPNRLNEVLRLPPRIRDPWVRSLVKEVKGLVTRGTFSIEDPLEGDEIVTAMDVYKCKLDPSGLIDKLKTRVVVRGDLLDKSEVDTWNPHASFLTLKIFLALCALRRMCPGQTDFVQAYLQAEVRDRVFVRLPAYWAKVMPSHLQKYCGIPLRLLKGLYGHHLSGKYFWEEQADFFTVYGLRSCEAAPALWYLHFGENDILIVLQYSDDLLFACTDDDKKADFLKALSKRFDHTANPIASWYLQARIRQDEKFNITLDQYRYSRSVVRRYLPNSPAEASPQDCKRYSDPLPYGFKFSIKDLSKTEEEVKKLESEYGWKFREVVGSLNFLLNTALSMLYCTRKACKMMHLPGEPHFKALLHMLHHLRCHPPGAIKFYSDVSKSPLAHMLIEAGHPDLDPSFVYATDSSFQDCDDSRSTACHLGFLQGGLVDPNSFVPAPIAHSSAEAENNGYCVTCMSAAHLRMIWMELLHGDSNRPYTVPILVDSAAADYMTKNDKDTKRTRHIERRWQFSRYCRKQGLVSMHKVDGNTHQLADVGTKNLTMKEAKPKYDIMTVPNIDDKPP